VISPLLIAPPRLISIAIRPPYVAECTSHPGPLVTTVSILPPKGERAAARAPPSLDGLISSGPGRRGS